MKRWPLWTMTMVLACVAIHLAGLDAALQWSRDANLARPWLAVTCHMTHWSTGHLAWNALAMIALGGWLERSFPLGMRWGVALAVGMIVPAVALGLPEVGTYRGLSGVASAMFVLAACQVAMGQGDGWRRAMGLAALGLFALKCGYEMWMGQAAFVAMQADVVVCPIAHVAGAVAGGIAAVVQGGGDHVRRWLVKAVN